MKTTKYPVPAELQSTSQLTREYVPSISQAKGRVGRASQAQEAAFDAGTASPQVLAERADLVAIVDGLHHVLAQRSV